MKKTSSTTNTRDKIKWIHAIANKNDIPRETWHEYMETMYNKKSTLMLTDKELDDVLRYVCDSRLVYNEKQLYLIMKMAEEIGITKETLDRMSAKFGAHNMEDLTESGIRGMLSIVNSMIEKKRKEATTVKSGETITVRIPNKVIYSHKMQCDVRVYTPRDGYIAIYDANHYMHDIDKMSDEKTEEVYRLKEQNVLIMDNPPWSFLVRKRVKMTAYQYNGKMIAMIIEAE